VNVCWVQVRQQNYSRNTSSHSFFLSSYFILKLKPIIMNILRNDKVVIAIATDFGLLNVEFTVVTVMPNYYFALLAQKRIVVGQMKVDGSWILSESIDLMDMKPISDVYHKMVSHSEYNQSEA
jgi:predicted small secreted protein